ncbi:MAG TPA: tryptophan 7-halogenase [Gemmatimonadaceae bacterium]|nr:tryptophan 7-halogenase [Gemmatimonadaceae bacterium]
MTPPHPPARPAATGGKLPLADVIVIGGGPAGATAARLLAKWGHAVSLLTRAPSRYALAESLPPSCGRLLDLVGIRPAVERCGFLRSTGNTVRWGAGEARIEQFAHDERGHQIERSAFDALLLTEAAASGTTVHEARVREVAPDAAPGAGGLTRVGFDSAGYGGNIAARWVLDCTGRAGLLARRGRRRGETGARTMAIVGVWENAGGFATADETHTLVESFEDGWAWSVPVSLERRYVTLMVDPEVTALAGRRGLAPIYLAELARTNVMSALVRGAGLLGRPWARDASPYRAERTASEGLLLVGDAASFVDPLSSYGIKKAIASAWLAAVVTHTALTDARRTSAALGLYESRERAMYETLRARAAELSRDAGGVAPAPFWAERAEPGDSGRAGYAPDGGPANVALGGFAGPDVAAFRRDADVLGALEEMKRRPRVRFRSSPAVRRTALPTVRGNEVVLETHLVAPAFADGVRWLRSVDLVKIVELADAYEQVPDLYEAYNRAAPPAALPDFLGALSVLVGKGLLEMT